MRHRRDALGCPTGLGTAAQARMQKEPIKPRKILILGGTGFLGPAQQGIAAQRHPHRQQRRARVVIRAHDLRVSKASRSASPMKVSSSSVTTSTTKVGKMIHQASRLFLPWRNRS